MRLESRADGKRLQLDNIGMLDKRGRVMKIQPAAMQRSGQLQVRTIVDGYLSAGIFDQDRMVDDFTALVSGNPQGIFPLRTNVCDLEWAADSQRHLPDLIEFESCVNDLWDQHDDVVISAYDLTKFSGDTIVDILRTHPVVGIGGVLRENPFYIPPAQFLKELHGRNSAKGGAVGRC
ncbi:MEDS domain-containing protein [Roseibium sp. M-1]